MQHDCCGHINKSYGNHSIDNSNRSNTNGGGIVVCSKSKQQAQKGSITALDCRV